VFHLVGLIQVVLKFIKKDKGKRVINEMLRLSSRVWCAKCQGFYHIFVNCTSKPLVIQEHKDIDEREDYCIQMYEPNSEDFSDLNEKMCKKRNLTL
jgi:hypothetical protein